MTGWNMALGVPMLAGLFALIVAASAVPVWLAAKVVGAGRSEFLRVLSALVLSSLLVLGLILLLGGWGYWLMPVVFVVVFGRMLDTSYFRAFVLCLLAMAFQGVISYVTGGFSETP